MSAPARPADAPHGPWATAEELALVASRVPLDLERIAEFCRRWQLGRFMPPDPLGAHDAALLWTSSDTRASSSFIWQG